MATDDLGVNYLSCYEYIPVSIEIESFAGIKFLYI